MASLPLAMAIALVAAALGRWTRWHPLVIAALVGLVPAVLAVFVMAGAFADGAAILAAGAAVYVVTGGFAAFGAFLGWLRRTHAERIR